VPSWARGLRLDDHRLQPSAVDQDLSGKQAEVALQDTLAEAFAPGWGWAEEGQLVGMELRLRLSAYWSPSAVRPRPAKARSQSQREPRMSQGSRRCCACSRSNVSSASSASGWWCSSMSVPSRISHLPTAMKATNSTTRPITPQSTALTASTNATASA